MFGDTSAGTNAEKDGVEKQSSFFTEQGKMLLQLRKQTTSPIFLSSVDKLDGHSLAVSPRSQGSRPSSASGPAPSGVDGRGSGEETSKRRRISAAKQAAESSTSADENLSALPCLVALNPGVRITTVAAGGRHTLALSGKSWVSWTTNISERSLVCVVSFKV